jgi:hypothetical protein
LRARQLLASSLVLTLLALMHPAWAWSNGGFSANPNNPDYGTHDWIVERALDWLPSNEKTLILTYRAAYLYGTELPDNCQAVDRICDTAKHHVYFRSSGALQDNASAVRALEMQSQALSAIAAGDYAGAAKWTGAMMHYISDLASFGHVMGASTDWGTEQHHSDYEEHVQGLTSTPAASVITLVFDGTLAAISPYDAALALAHDTTFDNSGAGHTAVWMDQHYNWEDPEFTTRVHQSINLVVNYVVESIHSTWSAADQLEGDCALNVTPSSVWVSGGMSASFTIAVPSCDASNEPVVLEVIGLPPGVSSTLSPPVIQPPPYGTANSTFMVIVGLNTPPRSYVINVTAHYLSTPSVVRWIPIILNVTQPLCDWTLTVEPTSLVVKVPGSRTAEVTLYSIGNCEVYNINVSLLMTGLPPGVTATFAPPSLKGTVGGTTESTMSISVSADASDGTFPLTIVGTADTYSSTMPFTLTVGEPSVAGFGTGLAFAIIGIGAGVAVALAGFGVALTQQTNYCRYCGNRVARDSRYCQFCGRQLA